MRISNEIVSPTGGDVKFWKSGAELQINKALFWDWVHRLLGNFSKLPYLVRVINEVAGPAGFSSGRSSDAC